MPYELTIIQERTYLHATVRGLNTSENVRHYLEEIIRECAARNCNRVLVEERLEGPRLDTIDVFQIVSEESGRVIGRLAAMAYVDMNASGDLMRFAETVAVNRGLPVKVFQSVGDAEKWLARA
ncbi:MAG TPA: hypothetical protein VFF82_03605 [Rhodocyclaceae bacterium]|nr:hypothetical protein [Rhodocyclaceae bacterium]